jgi:hypothetical protein
MLRLWAFLILGLGGCATLIWASDRITLQGERTIYTVICANGVWDGLQCAGHLVPGDRHRFRASHSRNEVVYWIAGSDAPSGRYTDCQVKNRDNWICTVQADQPHSIVREFSDGRPIVTFTPPFYAVAKWKWWALDAGLPGLTGADYGLGSSLPSSGSGAR